MTEGKTVKQRLAGRSKSDAINAKFILAAMAPFLLLALSDQAGLPRGILWHIWLVLSVVWGVGVVLIGAVAYWPSIRRSFRGKSRP